MNVRGGSPAYQPTANNRVGLGQIKTLVHDHKTSGQSEQVFIHPKDGSIHSIGLKNQEFANQDYQKNRETGKTLLFAAKLLSGGGKLSKEEKAGLSKEDKQYAKTAEKVVSFYQKEFKQANKKEMNVEETTALTDNLNKVGYSIDILASKQKAMMLQKQQALNEENKIKETVLTNSKIATYSDKMLPENRTLAATTASTFQNISAYGTAHSNNGADAVRHLMGGAVSIKDDNIDMFAQNRVSPAQIDHNDNDKDAVVDLRNKLGVALGTFEEKAATGCTKEQKDVLNKEVGQLLDKIASEESDQDGTAVLDKTLVKWAKSENPAEQNMSRLIHSMNQQYNIARAKAPMLLAANNGPDSPNRLTNLDVTKLDFQKNSRKIEYDFNGDNVTVTHSLRLNEGDRPSGSRLAVEQTTVLKSDINHLDTWQDQLTYNIVAMNKNADTLAAARTLNRIFTQAGFESKVTLPS